MGQILNKSKSKQGDSAVKSIDFKSKLDVAQDLKKLESSTNLIDVFPKYEQVYKYLEKKQHRVYGEIFILAEANDPNTQIAVQESFFQNSFEFEVEVERLKEMENLTQQHQNVIQLIKYFDYTHMSMCTSYHRLITVSEYHSRDLSTELFFRKLLFEKSTPTTTPKNGESSSKSKGNGINASSFSKGQRSLSTNSMAVQQQSQLKNSSMLQSKKIAEQQRKSVLYVTKVFSQVEERQDSIKDESISEESSQKENLEEKQIRNRSQFQFKSSDNAYRFQEKEFVYIMKSLISALCFLQMQNRTHQCIRSSSIFIARDGTIKLTDPKLFNQSSLYNYIYKGQSISGAYLSPLLVTNVEYSVVKPEHNVYKSDVFTLAVIMLEIAYLSKLDNYFDYTENCAVDVQGLQILADNLKDIYSQSTIALIKSMLDESEDIRPDFVSLAQKLGIFNASTNAVVQLSKNESSSLIYSKVASSTSSNQKPIPQATSIIIQPSDYSSTTQSPRFSKNQESIQQQTPKITTIADHTRKNSNVTHIINPYTQDTVRKSKDYVIPEKNHKQAPQTPTRSITPTRIQTVQPVQHIPLLTNSSVSNSSSPFNSKSKQDPINNPLMLSTPKKPELPASIDNNYRYMTPLPQVRLSTPENTTIQRHMHLLNQTPMNNNKHPFFMNKGISPIKTESTASDNHRTLKTESTVEIQRYQTRSTSPNVHHQSSPSKQPVTPKTSVKTTIISQYTPTRLSVNQSNPLTNPTYASTTSTQIQKSLSPISKTLPTTYQTEQSTSSTKDKNLQASPLVNYQTQQTVLLKEATRSVSPIGNGLNVRYSIQAPNGGLPTSSSSAQQKIQPITSTITPKQEVQPNLIRSSLSTANILTVGGVNKNTNINGMSASKNNAGNSRSPSPITSKSTKQIKNMISQTDEKPSANTQIQQHIQYKQILQQQQQQQQQNPSTSLSQNKIEASKPSLPNSFSNPQNIPSKQNVSNPTTSNIRSSITSLPQQVQQQQQKPPSLKSSQHQNRQSLQNLQIYTPSSQIPQTITAGQGFVSSQSTANRYSYSNIPSINYTSVSANTNNVSALSKLSQLNAPSNNTVANNQNKAMNVEPVTHKKNSNPKIPTNLKSQKHGSLQVNEQQVLVQQSMQSSSVNHTQTDSLTDSSQQLKSSSRQLQKSHRHSQSGNPFQYRSKTEVGNDYDKITPENQKNYDNFFKTDNDFISKSPTPFTTQGNLQILSYQQQPYDLSYKPYIPRMSINAITNQYPKEPSITQNNITQEGQNNQKQMESQRNESKNSSIIDGLGDLKPASELFGNKKTRLSIDLQQKQSQQPTQTQQKSLKSSIASSKSSTSVKQSQKRQSHNNSKVEQNAGKKELTMSQIDRELEKHRVFQKKLQEDMERQKQQQLNLQNQLTTPSNPQKLEKQSTLNQLIDQHILDNQLRQTPSDIIVPITTQNKYFNTTENQPLTTYNHTSTFGQQSSPTVNEEQERKLAQVIEELEEKPKNSHPPKEFGTDYIDQLIAKFKSEITSQINTDNNNNNSQHQLPPQDSTSQANNAFSHQNYNAQSNSNSINTNITSHNILNEKNINEPSSSERIMKRVESSGIVGVSGLNAGGIASSYNSKVPGAQGYRSSVTNNNEDRRVSTDYVVVGSRGDILNLPKSPNSIIKQNFTEINSIPLSLHQKADALSGLDFQEFKGQFNEQLKSKNPEFQQTEHHQHESNGQIQNQSSISTTPQQVSSVLNQETRLIYERMGSRDNTNSISQNTSVSNNSHSIQIILPRQGNLAGEKQSKSSSSQNNTVGMNSQEDINSNMNNFLIQNEEELGMPQGDQNNNHIQIQISRQHTFGANNPAILDAIKKGNLTEEQNQQLLSAQFNNPNPQTIINFPFTSFAQSSQQSNYNNEDNANNYNENNQILNNYGNELNTNEEYLNYNNNSNEEMNDYQEDTSQSTENFNTNHPYSNKNEILIISNSNNNGKQYQNIPPAINNDYCNLQREAATEFRTPNSKQQQLLTPASDSVFNDYVEEGQNNHQQGTNNFTQNYAQNGMSINNNMHQEQQYQYPSGVQSKAVNRGGEEVQTPYNPNQYHNMPYSGGSSSVYQLTVTPPRDSLPTPNVMVQQYDYNNNSNTVEENGGVFSDDQQVHQQNQQYYNQMIEGCSNISHIQQVNEDETYNSKRSFDVSADVFLIMRSNQDLPEGAGICTSNFNQDPNTNENNNYLQSPKKITSNYNNSRNINQYNQQQSDRYHNTNRSGQNQYTNNNNSNNYHGNKNTLFTPSPKKDDSMQFNQTFSELQMIQFLKNKENVIETYEDGSYYEGEKMSGVRHGRGKFFYGDGGSFQGEWQNGHMNGYGVLYYPTQRKAYEGEWDDDKFNGKGIMYNESVVEFHGTFNYHNMNEINDCWIKYEGDFKDDFKNGVGTLYLSNGERYIGRFKNDMVHGRGTFYKNDGTFITAEWSQNILLNYQ